MILVAKQMYLCNILSLHIESTDLFCLSFCGQTTGHTSSRCRRAIIIVAFWRNEMAVCALPAKLSLEDQLHQEFGDILARIFFDDDYGTIFMAETSETK